MEYAIAIQQCVTKLYPEFEIDVHLDSHTHGETVSGLGFPMFSFSISRQEWENHKTWAEHEKLITERLCETLHNLKIWVEKAIEKCNIQEKA